MLVLSSLSSFNDACIEFGRAIGMWIIGMNIWTLVLLVAALVLDRLLSSRVSAGWRLGLYLVVFARLTLPVEWASPLAWTTGSDTPPMIRYFESVSNGDGAGVSASSEETGAALGVNKYSHELDFSWWMFVPFCYMSIMIVLTGRWISARIQLARVLRTSTPADEDLQHLARCRRLEVHETFGPAVVGLMRPRIVLPADLIRAVPQETLSTVLAHERAHLLRGDHLMSALIQIMTILAWPIFPLWIAATRVRRLMEIACDEHALRSTDHETRRAYGEQLIALATSTRAGFNAPAIGHLGLGGDLPARFRAMRFIGGRRWPRGFQALVTVCCSFVLIACATQHRPASSTSPGMLPETVTYLVEVRVYEGWLAHEKLSFDMRQTASSTLNAPPPSVHVTRAKNTLNESEFNSALADYQQKGEGIIMSPRVMTRPGQDAVITVGSMKNDADDPDDGSTTTIRVSPIVGGLRLEAKYTEFGVPIKNEAIAEKSGPISTGLQRITLQSGETFVAVATGFIGQDTRMVSYTVRTIQPGDDSNDGLVEVNPNERWNVSLIAFDTSDEIPNEFLGAVASRFDINLGTRGIAIGTKIDAEGAAQLQTWLWEHGRERMAQKTGSKTLPNLGAMTWDVPHMAFGGDDVEAHSLTLGLGRSLDEAVYLLYRVHGESDVDETLQLPLKVGESLVLVVPLVNDSGNRILILGRTRYTSTSITPQTADGVIRDAEDDDRPFVDGNN